MADVYGAIAGLCAQRGISVGRMCAAVGVPRGNLAALKTGHLQTLPPEMLQRVANYFSVSTSCLLGAAQGSASQLAELLEELRHNPRKKTFFSLTQNATREDVQTALHIVETFLAGRSQQ